jgi:hypothetical protein
MHEHRHCIKSGTTADSAIRMPAVTADSVIYAAADKRWPFEYLRKYSTLIDLY